MGTSQEKNEIFFAARCRWKNLIPKTQPATLQLGCVLGYKDYKVNGGKVGRKKGSIKTNEQKKEEYKEIIQLLK